MMVLVLGGTGAIGVHFVKLLFECGIEIFVTSRSLMARHRVFYRYHRQCN